LAEQIDSCCNEQSLDRLCARLQSVMGEVAELEVGAASSAADQIAARRSARRAGRVKGRRGASA
jgi:outer membrane murein-binding lipoprotein Lpp